MSAAQVRCIVYNSGRSHGKPIVACRRIAPLLSAPNPPPHAFTLIHHEMTVSVTNSLANHLFSTPHSPAIPAIRPCASSRENVSVGGRGASRAMARTPQPRARLI
ncbi:hypothetical protein SKAU_G00260570 [Synaphobranchus kaupii]|uniref:Uncharacterized protein n=1 Tax=Synaphobranchus kaupii TaxID=118154 RepID=A0A9Q1F532_SYNKA|nr:hypothetical protein SKAU_G00260570 [Synaphobranchus kaupii]